MKNLGKLLEISATLTEAAQTTASKLGAAAKDLSSSTISKGNMLVEETVDKIRRIDIDHAAHLEKLSEITTKVTEAAQATASQLGASATAGAEAVKGFSSSTLSKGSMLVEQAIDNLPKIDLDHAALVEKTKVVEDSAKVVAGAAAASALIAAPTGIAAVGVALGVTSAPLLVTAAPIIGGVAGSIYVATAATRLYSRSRKNKAEALSTFPEDAGKTSDL